MANSKNIIKEVNIFKNKSDKYNDDNDLAKEKTKKIINQKREY